MKIFLILSTFLFLSCSSSLSRSDLETILENDSIELKNVCAKFLSNSNIQEIRISKVKGSHPCDEAINSWYGCESQWQKMDIENNRTMYLDSKAEVLSTEKINSKDYIYFANFLMRHNIQTIAKSYGRGDCVDLESGLNGLRFSTNKNYQLKKDFEYLIIEKINSNWSVYSRDWN
jgi:hypothetical protein